MARRDFTITGGKGFSMPLGAGWKLSVQFGRGNYGSNQDYGLSYGQSIPCGFTYAEIGYDADESEEVTLGSVDLLCGARGADSVEIAVFDGNGNFRNVDTLERDETGYRDVDGWVGAGRIYEVWTNVRNRIREKIRG